MNYSVLIVAAGKGAKTGESYKKALASFKGKQSVLGQTMSIFLKDEQCRQIIVVASSADLRDVVADYGRGKIVHVKGGQSRVESVAIGLHAVSEEIVLIHDGIRPWLKQHYIDDLLACMQGYKAAVLGIKIHDSLRRVKDGVLGAVMDKNACMLIQTPQAYQTNFIIECYRKAQEQGLNFVDDAEIASGVSQEPIAVVEGDIRNSRFIL